MRKKKIKILNELGLHARPAAKFVKLASQFQSQVYVNKDGVEVNGKSIMGLMMLAAEHGSILTLKVFGEDEESAINELEKLIKNKFEE